MDNLADNTSDIIGGITVDAIRYFVKNKKVSDNIADSITDTIVDIIVGNTQDLIDDIIIYSNE